MGKNARLTVIHVARAIARLKDRGGSRYTDIRNALSNGSSQPTFFQLKAILAKACKEGVIRQNAQGRWQLNLAGLKTRSTKEVVSSTSLSRRRRCKGKGRGKGRRKGKKKKRKGKRRGRKGRKGKKGKGKKRKRKRRRRRRKSKGKK